MIKNSFKILSLIVIIALSSCSSTKLSNGLSVQKRRYTNGWHFNTTGKHLSNGKVAATIKVNEQKELTPNNSNDHMVWSAEELSFQSSSSLSVDGEQKKLSLKERILKKVLFSKLEKLVKESEANSKSNAINETNKEAVPNGEKDKNDDEYGDETNILGALALALTFLIPIVPLILGIVALTQIKNNPGKYDKASKGFAIVAVVIGILYLAVIALVIWALSSINSGW